YSRMPHELLVPPWGTAGWLQWVPVTPAWAAAACAALRAAAWAAALGLGTRVSAWSVALLSVYVFGIPQLFGKVNHHAHHLVWFAAILAASPCADVWSVDALVARRRAGANTPAPAPHQAYALPLRLVWLLYGV